MPQLKYDYDYYYDTASKSRSTTKSGRSISRNTQNSKREAQTISRSTIEANRASIRSAINSDEELYIRRSRANTKSNEKVNTRFDEVDKMLNANTARKIQKIEAEKVSKAVPKEKAKVKSKTKVKNNTKSSIKEKDKSKKIVTKKSENKKESKPKEMSLKNAELMVDADTKARLAEEKKHKVLRNLAASLIAFSVLFLICYRSSCINESFKSVSKMKTEFESIQTMNAQLESEIQTQTDLSNIETYAKFQLGMQKPKSSQIRKIYTQKEDKIATPVVIAEQEEPSFWEKLVNDLKNLMD